MAINVPTLAEVQAARRGKAIPKGPTRLETTTVAAPAQKKADGAFRQAVFVRDKGRCRCCLRRVEQILDRVEKRAEAHHVHGKVGKLRHLVRAALLLCMTCHERVTGKVNDKLLIVGTKFFLFEGQRLIDAAKPVTFKEAA